MFKLIHTADIWTAVALNFFFFIGLISSENNFSEIVKITNGLLRGKDVGLYYSWDSIPYAEPPLGDLRFEAPLPYRSKWNDVYNATSEPAFCMQWFRGKGINKLSGIEDCLVLGVYRPKNPDIKKFPVMVYIHGGGFMSGGSAALDPLPIMASGKIMLVKIQYRLGPLGFLSTQDSSIPGNYGLKDQVLALQWVNENIAQFGGDPEKVLLYGASVGGAASHLHMLRPTLNATVKVVVSASGVALNSKVIQRNAQETAFKLAELVQCSITQGTEKLKKCLKQVKAEDLVRNVQGLLNFGYNPTTTFGPVIELENVPSAFMTSHPMDILKSGQFSHLPWLASYTTEDGGFNAAELMAINPQTNREYIYLLNDQWLELAPQNLYLNNISPQPRNLAKVLKDHYMNNESFSKESYLKVQEMYTVILFKNDILQALQLQSQYSTAPVYGYIYDNPADYNIGYALSQRKDIQFGTNHMDDVSLILKFPQRSPFRPDEEVISRNLIKMLIDFVETGQLSYDKCRFQKNIGTAGKDLSLILITRCNCENVERKYENLFKDFYFY